MQLILINYAVLLLFNFVGGGLGLVVLDGGLVGAFDAIIV